MDVHLGQLLSNDLLVKSSLAAGPCLVLDFVLARFDLGKNCCSVEF